MVVVVGFGRTFVVRWSVLAPAWITKGIGRAAAVLLTALGRRLDHTGALVALGGNAGDGVGFLFLQEEG